MILFYRQVYIVIKVFYLKVELIINGNKQELILIKEHYEGPVGDYGIARNTIKCLFKADTCNNQIIEKNSESFFASLKE